MSLIKITNKYTHHVNSNIKHLIDTNLDKEYKYNLRIVYYINCLVNPNYFDWLKNQIALVYKYDAIIYIMATIDNNSENEFKQKVWKNFPQVIIECNYKNNFEYDGIYKLWELGQIFNDKNDIFLYFHSKGISRNSNYAQNKNDIYNIIFKDYELIKDIYNTFPTINKIGYSCDKCGFIWYNFYFVRGSYVKNLERPIKTSRRHYYEDYLCRIVNKEKDKYTLKEKKLNFYKKNMLDCYNIYKNNNGANIGTWFSPTIYKFINI